MALHRAFAPILRFPLSLSPSASLSHARKHASTETEVQPNTRARRASPLRQSAQSRESGEKNQHCSNSSGNRSTQNAYSTIWLLRQPAASVLTAASQLGASGFQRRREKELERTVDQEKPGLSYSEKKRKHDTTFEVPGFFPIVKTWIRSSGNRTSITTILAHEFGDAKTLKRRLDRYVATLRTAKCGKIPTFVFLALAAAFPFPSAAL